MGTTATRRDILLGAASSSAFAVVLGFPQYADAKSFEEGMSRYVRRKPLDPIDTYIPSVLLTREQYAKIEYVLDGDASVEDKAVRCRELLRDGPAAAMRDNIRAVARFVSEQSGSGSEQDKSAQQTLASYFTNIDTLDSTLFQAKRNGELSEPQIKALQANLAAGLAAIDQIVSLVPDTIVNQSREVIKVSAGGTSLDATKSEGGVEPPSESSDVVVVAPSTSTKLRVSADLF